MVIKQQDSFQFLKEKNINLSSSRLALGGRRSSETNERAAEISLKFLSSLQNITDSV